MAPNEEPDASKATVSSHHSSSAVESETPACPDSSSQQQSGQRKKAENTSAFSHPGARVIAQQAADGDGPYRCRKCGNAVLTVSIPQCIACLDNYPWIAPADGEEPV